MSREATLKLINEVFGLAAFEQEIREVIGNTNWEVLALRTREARAALSAPSEAVAFTGIDSQVIVAAAEMTEAQKGQPAWLWYDQRQDVRSFGRWAAYDNQAPYIRADIAALSPDTAATQDEGGHVWHEKVFSSMKIKCCMNCGFIFNEDQPNKPCPGPVGVEPRSPDTAATAPVSPFAPDGSWDTRVSDGREAPDTAARREEREGVTPAQYEFAAERLTIALEGELDGLCVEMDKARKIVDFVLTETFGRAPAALEREGRDNG